MAQSACLFLRAASAPERVVNDTRALRKSLRSASLSRIGHGGVAAAGYHRLCAP